MMHACCHRSHLCQPQCQAHTNTQALAGPLGCSGAMISMLPPPFGFMPPSGLGGHASAAAADRLCKATDQLQLARPWLNTCTHDAAFAKAEGHLLLRVFSHINLWRS